jgi:hypothetical protein
LNGQGLLVWSTIKDLLNLDSIGDEGEILGEVLDKLESQRPVKDESGSVHES